MIVYTGPLDDTPALILFARREADKLRSLRKLIVTRNGTTLRDVNGNGIEFPGLTCGCEGLERLLQEFGIIFPTVELHNPDSMPNGVREFDLSACWTWGYG